MTTRGVKFVLTGCGYGLDTMALFMACKDAGIKCMEVQHGIGAGHGHRWYSSWTKMPLDGTRYEMLPDIYWCWSEADKKIIDSWSDGRHLAYVGRRPIYSVMDKIEAMTKQRPFAVENNNPNILLSLQPNVNYPSWLINIIKETSTQYNWLIRKHPRFDTLQENLIASISMLPNVYIDGMSEIMLEKLLVHTNLHVTNHSAVAIDALEFGIKTIIIGNGYEDVFFKEIEAGNVLVGDNEETFRQAFDKCDLQNDQIKHISKDLYETNRAFILEQIKK